MKIGIISDTHGRHHSVTKAVQIFTEQKVDYILHAGDMETASTIRDLSDVGNAKFVFILGNCDRDRQFLKDTARNFNAEAHDNIYEGSIEGRRIYMRHIPLGIEELAGTGNYDIIIHGHTHKKEIRKVNDTLIANPGNTSVLILDLKDLACKDFDI